MVETLQVHVSDELEAHPSENNCGIWHCEICIPPAGDYLCRAAVFPNATVEKSDMLLKTYSGECMAVVSEMHVDAQYTQNRGSLSHCL